MMGKAGKGRGTVAAVALILALLACSSCGRKAKPEPRWGGSGTIIPVSAAKVSSAPENGPR